VKNERTGERTGTGFRYHKQEAKGISRRLHGMTPRTRHAAYTARAAADLSRVTDWQTDTANIGNNSQHLMHSMQPKKLETWLRRPYLRQSLVLNFPQPSSWQWSIWRHSDVTMFTSLTSALRHRHHGIEGHLFPVWRKREL